MGEKIAFENGRISDFQGLMILTLTLDQVILHTVMHHSSTYISNFIEIEEVFVDGRTYGRVDRRTFETGLIRLSQRSRPNNSGLNVSQRPFKQSGLQVTFEGAR